MTKKKHAKSQRQTKQQKYDNRVELENRATQINQENQEKKSEQMALFRSEIGKSFIIMCATLPIINGVLYDCLGKWLLLVVIILTMMALYEVVTLIYIVFPLSQTTWIKRFVPKKIKDVFDYFSE